MRDMERARDAADRLAPELTELRHALHRHPEIGLHLPVTQQTVLKALAGLGLEISTGKQLTSVTAVLRGGRPGPAVLLRADMDALPVQERTGVDFASRIDGVMHACGHDLHTAMLVGAARILAERRADLAGDVVFMFQPGEEGWDGARLMIEEGVLDAAGPRVTAAYALHVMSARLPRGEFATRPGTVLSACSELTVEVQGHGGHGSVPHLGLDPVPATAEMVLALQTMVTRRFDIFDPVVLSVGTIHGGTASNVLPDQVRFQATVRTFSPGSLARMQEETVRLCRQIGAAHGLTVDVSFDTQYPATVNDPGCAERVARTAADLFGPERYTHMDFPHAGSEDFSRVTDQVPGCFVVYGACTGDDHTVAADNHSGSAAFADEVLADGAALYAALAMRRPATEGSR
ncbi:M20 family metallopeptidase [Streptomyces sp. NPDC048637]|uniref:M20 metallopeptidase family protein n=1 Tax=Streptomyces sp. NPDC048637 TaxID=3155636 RepID=UPI00343DA8C5